LEAAAIAGAFAVAAGMAVAGAVTIAAGGAAEAEASTPSEPRTTPGRIRDRLVVNIVIAEPCFHMKEHGSCDDFAP
jgi:hypothetical protein